MWVGAHSPLEGRTSILHQLLVTEACVYSDRNPSKLGEKVTDWTVAPSQDTSIDG